METVITHQILLLFLRQQIPARYRRALPSNPGTPGQDGLGTLLQGFVESSNVNVVEEMVGLISSQRAYEINSRAIRTADDMMQTANNLVRV